MAPMECRGALQCQAPNTNANPPQGLARSTILGQVPSEDDSRLSRLARPAGRGFAPSRAELEKQYMETQRRRLAEERKHNEKSMRDAIDHPQVSKTVKAREPTIPRQFNLSCTNTPVRSRAQSRCTTPSRSRCTTPARSCSSTPGRSFCSDLDSDCSASRGRHRSSSNRALTVPKGPNLRTSLRPRSLSQRRSSEWEQGASLRSNSRKASASPGRSAFGRSCIVTPRRGSCNDSCGSISSNMDLSVAGSSVRSRMSRSCDSRLSQLSQRSCSKQILSTDEIEQLRIVAKRHELKELMKQNEKRGRKAINCPTPTCTRRSTSLTVPREFNLSCPATPSRSVMSDADSDGEEGTWSHSLRSVSASARAWQPALTKPAGPMLQTERRSRSSSAFRAASGETPGQRSVSRHKVPREQAAIERHLERAAGPQILPNSTSTTESTKPAWNDSTQPEPKDGAPDMGLDDWVRSAVTPEERAKRAREVAQRRHTAKVAEKAAQVKCFTGAKALATPRQGGRPGLAFSGRSARGGL